MQLRVVLFFSLAIVLLSGCGIAGLGNDTVTVSASDLAESGSRQDVVDNLQPLLESDVTDLDPKIRGLLPDLPSVDYGPEPAEIFDVFVGFEQQQESHQATRQIVFQTTEPGDQTIARLEENTIAGYTYLDTTESSGEGLVGDAIVTDTTIQFVADQDEDDLLRFFVKTESDSSITQTTVQRQSQLTEPVEFSDFMATYSGWVSDFPIDDEVQVLSMSVERRFQALTLFVPPLTFTIELRSDTQSGPELVADFEQNATAQGWTKTGSEDRDNFFTHPDNLSLIHI